MICGQMIMVLTLEILLKVALNTKNQSINSNQPPLCATLLKIFKK
jgi:hypothetical protein